jgi:hypothetical protein
MFSVKNTLYTLSLALATLSSTTYAKYDCYQASGNGYPYCVNAPDNASGDLPGIMFLSGSGARGPASQVKQLVGVILLFFLTPCSCLSYAPAYPLSMLSMHARTPSLDQVQHSTPKRRERGRRLFGRDQRKR